MQMGIKLLFNPDRFFAKLRIIMVFVLILTGIGSNRIIRVIILTGFGKHRIIRVLILTGFGNLSGIEKKEEKNTV